MKCVIGKINDFYQNNHKIDISFEKNELNYLNNSQLHQKNQLLPREKRCIGRFSS